MSIETLNNQPPKPEDIVADFVALLDKLLQSNNINMRDLIVLKRKIHRQEIPSAEDLAKFDGVADDIAILKQKAGIIGPENIPWADLKMAIENAKLKY